MIYGIHMLLVNANIYTGTIIYLGNAVSDVNQDNFTLTRNQQQNYDLNKKERGHKSWILQHAKKKERDMIDRSLKSYPHHGQSDGREAMVWSGEVWYMVGM